jgi:hypothetical protein
MNHDRKDFNTWKMEARGKTFEPPMKGVVGPIGFAYKKRVCSKNRVHYPLKRTDWDTKGERNTPEQGQESLCAHLLGRGSGARSFRAQTGESRRFHER